ncbi:MAG: CHASE3 domain-containing protein [Gammaproteobacteria bacterium]
MADYAAGRTGGEWPFPVPDRVQRPQLRPVCSGDCPGLAATRQRLRPKGLPVDVETGQRSFVLTEAARFLKLYDNAIKSFDNTMQKLRQLTPSREMSKRIDGISALADERVRISSTVVALVEHGQSAEALAMVREGRGRHIMEEFRSGLLEFERLSNLELAELRKREGSAVFWPRVAVFVFALLVFGLLITVTRLFIRDAIQHREMTRSTGQESQRMQRLIEARTAELSDLSSHLQTVSEREKAELARNLHDELGGLLTVAKMDLSWLQGATKGLDPQIDEKLRQLSHAFTEAMDVKRRVVESLWPALRDHFGLPTPLQNYFDVTCKQPGLNCNTANPEDVAEIPQDLAIALFRVGQEALTNIIRHAKARNVEMSFDVIDDVINLVVRDDGTGLNLAGRQFRGSMAST